MRSGQPGLLGRRWRRRFGLHRSIHDLPQLGEPPRRSLHAGLTTLRGWTLSLPTQAQFQLFGSHRQFVFGPRLRGRVGQIRSSMEKNLRPSGRRNGFFPDRNPMRFGSWYAVSVMAAQHDRRGERVGGIGADRLEDARNRTKRGDGEPVGRKRLPHRQPGRYKRVDSLQGRDAYDTHRPPDTQHQQGAVRDHGRRSGHAVVSADQGPGQTGRAAGRQVSARGRADLQLHQFGLPSHLRVDAVQFDLAAPAHFAVVQVRPVQRGLCGDSGRAADAHRRLLVRGHGRCRAQKPGAFFQPRIRLPADPQRRSTLPDGFPVHCGPACREPGRCDRGDQTGRARRGAVAGHHAD